MKTIVLTGRLAKSFGKSFDLEVRSTGEAVRALCYMIEGFEQALRDGLYRVVKTYSDREEALGKEDILFNLGKATGIRIEPVIAGAKKQGLGKIILGVVLIGAAFAFSGGALGGTAFSVAGQSISFGQIATFGGSLLLSGLSSLLSPQIKRDTDDKTTEIKSFLLESPRNVVEQGHPIWLIYGTVHTGSIVVLTGISTEELPI